MNSGTAMPPRTSSLFSCAATWSVSHPATRSGLLEETHELTCASCLPPPLTPAKSSTGSQRGSMTGYNYLVTSHHYNAITTPWSKCIPTTEIIRSTHRLFVNSHVVKPIRCANLFMLKILSRTLTLNRWWLDVIKHLYKFTLTLRSPKSIHQFE